MYNIYNIIMGHTNEQLQEKAASDATFHMVKSVQDPIGYLMIIKKLFFSIQSGHHPIRSIFLETRWLYNTMQNANENTTTYQVRFRNAQKVNEACNGIPITKRVL